MKQSARSDEYDSNALSAHIKVRSSVNSGFKTKNQSDVKIAHIFGLTDNLNNTFALKSHCGATGTEICYLLCYLIEYYQNCSEVLQNSEFQNQRAIIKVGVVSVPLLAPCP